MSQVKQEFDWQELSIIASYANLKLTSWRLKALAGKFKIVLERVDRLDQIEMGETLPAHVQPYNKE